MRFVVKEKKTDIGKLVLDALRNAVNQLAVVYFNPNDEVLDVLRDVMDLTLIISEEFVINNPYKIETLCLTAKVRSVPMDSENGKLHAKVLIATDRDGGRWVLVGSANMTWPGLFWNQEACIVLDSRNESDVAAVKASEKWFTSLLKDKNTRCPNIEAAKKVFDSRLLYRLEPRPVGEQARDTESRYWALNPLLDRMKSNTGRTSSLRAPSRLVGQKST
jgi:phosphatidylserine/phosphatidylglycerophosphate/cardiolipin synthase-like enzyme